jgi:hypothetical protein
MGEKLIENKLTSIDPDIGITRRASNKIKHIWPKTGQYSKR